MSSIQVDQVRDIVQSAFASLGIIGSIGDLILVHGGQCTGRRFICDGFEAFWCFDTGMVNIYDQNDQLLQSLNVEAVIEQPMTAA